MANTLRALDSMQRAIDTCAFCPKLCRFACPVAEAETRETVTPWGLLTRVSDVRRGTAPLDAQTAEIWHHCTGCGRCTEVCKHHNPVFEVLLAARAEADRAGVSPAGVAAGARARPEPTPTFEVLPETGPVRLLPGAAPEASVAAAIRLLVAAGWGPPGRLGDTVMDAGGALLAAGLPADHAAHERRLCAAAEGAEVVICLDADDAVTLRSRAVGPALGASWRVLHLTEALAERPPSLRAAHEGDVLYLDACRLGRGLGVYDPPRALLAAAIRGSVREAVMTREEGGCCGHGGGYAATAPEGAAAVAREALEAGLGAAAEVLTVVIAGPACAGHLERAAVGRRVVDWAVFLAESLSGEEET